MSALDGIRVLDLSRVLAGPFCTCLLVDLGADVVKVEPPGGDDTRHLGPFLNGASVYFAMLNRGKRGIALNLKDDADRAEFLQLAERADVIVENFRPGVAERLGVGAAEILRRNPRAVYASISGFGQYGALAARPAYDLIVQAMSGIMAATGEPDGQPIKVGESLADLVAGLYAAWAVCAALVQRNRTGLGQHLDIAMLDSLVSLQPTGISQLVANGTAPGRVGNRHPVSTPFGTYQSADGQIALAAANDRTFHAILAMIERPELAADPRFRSDTDRTVHEPQLRAAIEQWTRARKLDEISAEAEVHGVPAGPVQDLAGALDTLGARDVIGQLHHPALGDIRCLRQPVRFGADLPNSDHRPAVPELGGDRTEVLRDWLGD